MNGTKVTHNPWINSPVGFARGAGVYLPMLLSTFFLGCGGSGPPPAPKGDTELTLQVSAARTAILRGAWPQAASLYRLALQRAEVMDDPVAIADTAYNYATALVELADYDRATAALDEARAEAARAGAPATDIAVLQAKAARLSGHPDAAAALIDAVLTNNAASPADRLQATILKGQLACDRKDLPAARDAVVQARGLVAKGTSPLFAAGIEGLNGSIALLEQHPADAATLFDRQADFLRQAKFYGDMVHALSRAAAAYGDANHPALSADRYYRAARSAIAQHGVIDPQPLLDAAAVQAEKSGDPALLDRVNRLRKTRPATAPVS